MRRPDDLPCGVLPQEERIQEELMLALSDSILRVIAGLGPVSRLRILAFLHLLEKPDSLRTRLEVGASGDLRLTLSAEPGAAQAQKH
ncbi:hypothetical protein [Microvirga sp. 17 mud 1-3]|uniref:hypothetical protein n=1 Tax=Microvirga sp. 17 mud 1-3 TaxID=2082949 RepID=UPI000D6C62BA|nr:hypothetical protein [Microvirga sp. 17 mud 1-3]AWM86066.1 hypothetical protein C4E04_04455 [Microvirga sp. 17 mud 1-3]